MILSHVVAISKNNVIGKNNGIPWDLPEDRKHFRDITLNHPIVMGRKTFDSLGKPLPKRSNIVISQSLKNIPGCTVLPTIKDAISFCGQHFPHEKELFIIGGAEIYRQTLSLVSKIHLTIIHQDFDGDTFYPKIPEEFQETHREDKTLPFPYSFLTLENSSFQMDFISKGNENLLEGK